MKGPRPNAKLAGLVLGLGLMFAVASAAADGPRVPAFPGAEGYGRLARGGRGGDVYHVTTLDDRGPGSLRAGLEKLTGPRTIVFDVSGTIRLASELKVTGTNGLTIAGQTAPGEGITLRDHTLKFDNVSDVIVRYLRVRLGDESKTSSDTIGISRARNMILDHVTATWGVDGNMDTEYLSNFTLQWSLYGEALHRSTHQKGPHAMLMSFRKAAGPVSIHHNLLFSSRDRHPSLGGGSDFDPQAIHDFRNNVLYNWEGPLNLGAGRFVIVGNYWRPGPNTDATKHPMAPKVSRENVTFGWIAGNLIEGKPEWSRDNYLAVEWGVRGGSYTAEVTRAEFVLLKDPVSVADQPTLLPSEQALDAVLAQAGASLHRDAADRRIVDGIRNRTHRRIDSQREVAGWPELKTAPAPPDTDRDGMPDAWEKARGLDPSDPADRNADRDGDGYTNLEEYLNSLCPPSPLIGGAPSAR